MQTTPLPPVYVPAPLPPAAKAPAQAQGPAAALDNAHSPSRNQKDNSKFSDALDNNSSDKTQEQSPPPAPADKETKAPSDSNTASDNGSTTTTQEPPKSDAAISPQVSGIALPAVGAFIDQQAVPNTTVTADAIDPSAAPKKFIYENEIGFKANPAAANEVDHSIEKYNIANRRRSQQAQAQTQGQTQTPTSAPAQTQTKTQAQVQVQAQAQNQTQTQPQQQPANIPATSANAAAEVNAALSTAAGNNTTPAITGADGKINIAALSDASQETNVNQQDFAKAVNKLIQDKQAPAANQNTAPQTASNADSSSAPTTSAHPQQTAAKSAAHTLQQSVANALTGNNADSTNTEADATANVAVDGAPATAKVAAKVISVKNDTIKLASDVSADQLAAKLENLDSQLTSRSLTGIKSAHDALSQTPIDQIQIRVSQAVIAGATTDKISINLHPMELGSVDVNMHVDHEGNTKIHITADRPETLDLLRNNSHDLTKSLADAGVKTDSTNLQFSLRGEQNHNQNFGQAQNDNNNNGNNGQQQQNQQQASANNYSRFTNLSEQDLNLSVATKNLNILV